MVVAITTKVNFWADTLAKASLEELRVIRSALLSRRVRPSGLVLMVESEIEARERGFTTIPKAAPPDQGDGEK